MVWPSRTWDTWKNEHNSSTGRVMCLSWRSMMQVGWRIWNETDLSWFIWRLEMLKYIRWGKNRWYRCCMMLLRFVKLWFCPLDLNKKTVDLGALFLGHTFRSLRPTEVGWVGGVTSQHGERCKECHRSVAGRSAGWKNGMLWSQGEPGNWD